MILKLAGDFKSFSLFQDFVFFWWCCVICGMLFPQPEIKPCPCIRSTVLTTGPPRKSPGLFLNQWSSFVFLFFFFPNDQLFYVSQDNFKKKKKTTFTSLAESLLRFIFSHTVKGISLPWFCISLYIKGQCLQCLLLFLTVYSTGWKDATASFSLGTGF